MTQTAQVTQIFPNGTAQVAVIRQGACAHNCSECGGCMTAAQPTVTALAQNSVGAREGELVVVETENAQLMGIIAFVYLVPMALLIAGYLAAQAAGLTQGWCILAAVAAFAVSILLVVALDRSVKRRHALQFRIVAVQEI
ncbi:SoxR reducing system RseC family protein [uncultured Intestinimonas sp.]|uniref:SoxR reducing system RseC family protein n=1 Tax=uncultured Intestinimonas sp. TaxID=1689265 RepID=UPI0025EA1C63|nr:SoxR reducing system RseC family protein [uncultured Intestinimonas sp.]